ncbi:putative centrosomal protein [Paratrimastix pyriformis]|uniref:Centrosomal protein n=1 Tax=Paratrimastix pyriformis TaxID=342808 RepID=A0ABQ8U1U3_9EUKA|nr:putative centrosomal protein [Paratrimastix pyriformis]
MSQALLTRLDEVTPTGGPALPRQMPATKCLEIAYLDFHREKECVDKANYAPCPRCHTFFHKSQLDAHVRAAKCTPPLDTSVASRCPLCLGDITPPGDAGWQRHFLQSPGCPGNERTKHLWSVSIPPASPAPFPCTLQNPFFMMILIIAQTDVPAFRFPPCLQAPRGPTTRSPRESRIIIILPLSPIIYLPLDPRKKDLLRTESRGLLLGRKRWGRES